MHIRNIHINNIHYSNVCFKAKKEATNNKTVLPPKKPSGDLKCIPNNVDINYTTAKTIKAINECKNKKLDTPKLRLIKKYIMFQH